MAAQTKRTERNDGKPPQQAEACYALLLQGSHWLEEDRKVEIHLGSTLLSSSSDSTQAGTGYFKKVVDGPFVNAEMGHVSVPLISKNAKIGSALAWGSLYWQYFEDLDKITPSATPLRLAKKLFVEKTTDRGLVLEPVDENQTLKIGDKIQVRIELRVDRDMEYVHMKDMRASCLEPQQVLSGTNGRMGWATTAPPGMPVQISSLIGCPKALMYSSTLFL